MFFTAERSAFGANIIGTKGNDFLVGDEEVNTIRALAGDDQVHGGSSRDKVYGDKGNDYVVGNEGGDLILGGKGIDTLNGGPGNDNVRGENSDDFLTGGEGDDTLMGGSGNDSIFGSSGNDNLVAGPGDDYMVGGPGADRFSCGQGVDQIADFNPSEGDTMSADCQNNEKARRYFELFELFNLIFNHFEWICAGHVHEIVGISAKKKTLDF